MFQFGGLGASFGGIQPPKAQHGDGTAEDIRKEKHGLKSSKLSL